MVLMQNHLEPEAQDYTIRSLGMAVRDVGVEK
jgi:hypothetical protein